MAPALSNQKGRFMQLMYFGGAMDVSQEPTELQRSEGGKILKNKPPLGVKVTSKEMEVYHLRGTDFPKGKPVDIGNNAALARKAKALKCFEVIGEEEAQPGPEKQEKRKGKPSKHE